ncbi:MAG: MFS transporter [Oscillospiraceae bacterium]|nr:MFS transporter [Oscillospiraceae bacterium]
MKDYKRTIAACFVGFFVQAIVINYAPLLFVMFSGVYDISLGKIALLVSFNFGLQLLTDAAAAAFVDRIGYKASVVLAHGLAGVGLLGLCVLPEVMPNAFAGLLLSTSIYAVGGGLLEVLLSPIVDACPAENKEKAMSMLHSAYSWGVVAVVLLSTLAIRLFGMEHWRWYAVAWAAVPLLNGVAFLLAPMPPPHTQHASVHAFLNLFKNGEFWLFALIMLCAGATEQAAAQWASAYAETALGIPKTIGDVAGPAFLCAVMGFFRSFYGKFGDKLPLRKYLFVCCGIGIVSYVLIAASPWAWLGIVGFGLCGVGAAVMWPGTFSVAAQKMPNGGTALFALLALFGDMGCALGPQLVGSVAEHAGDNLRLGMYTGAVFPLLLAVGMALQGIHRKRRTEI